MKGKRIRKITPYLYVAPALLLAFLFCYRPFFLTITDSLFHVSGTGERLRFVGFDNYARLFASESFQDSWRNTIVFALLFVPLNLFVTFSLALITNKKNHLMEIDRDLLLLPMATAMSSAVLIFKLMFDENVGIVNRMLPKDVRWFSDGPSAMLMLVIVGIWLDIGFDFLLLSSSLRNIPQDLQEVADLEGASVWQRFRYLELPMAGPTVFFVFCNNVKDAFLICSPVMILTEGGPYRSTQTLVYQMYLEGFKGGNIATGSAIATIVFLVSLGLLLLMMAYQRKRIFYQ